MYVYFDGKKTTEEILYRTDMSKRQLRDVLHHFEDCVGAFAFETYFNSRRARAAHHAIASIIASCRANIGSYARPNLLTDAMC